MTVQSYRFLEWHIVKLFWFTVCYWEYCQVSWGFYVICNFTFLRQMINFDLECTKKYLWAKNSYSSYFCSLARFLKQNLGKGSNKAFWLKNFHHISNLNFNSKLILKPNYTDLSMAQLSPSLFSSMFSFISLDS